MKAFINRFPVISRLIIAAIVVALIGLLVWGVWTLAYNQGWVSRAPTWDFASLVTKTDESMTEPDRAIAQSTVPPTTPQAAVTTPEPAKAPETKPATPTAEPTLSPTAEPTAQPTAPPTEAPTVPKAVYTLTGKTVSFTMKDQDGKESAVTLETFIYGGGWQRGTDSWLIAKDGNLTKETPESFGIPISGEEWATKISNWLKAAVGDPWTLTWFRFQMHLESFSSMEKANQYAQNLISLPTEEYDKIANATLEKFFKRIDKGRAEVDPGWDLEVMLREPGNSPREILELFARTNSDSNHTPDLLVAFYSKGESTSFTSYKGAWKIAAKAAGVNANNYKARAYVNLTEGGTWKWKATGRGKSGGNPTDAPSSTSTPTPTKKPNNNRPTKNPEARPTSPVGGGETNPKNSEDPHTTEHTESTPAPKVTEAPKPTPTPTPVPTAVVRPTENCATAAPTPIREDKNTPPPADKNHNVSTDKPSGVADDSFDPGSI